MRRRFHHDAGVGEVAQRQTERGMPLQFVNGHDPHLRAREHRQGARPRAIDPINTRFITADSTGRTGWRAGRQEAGTFRQVRRASLVAGRQPVFLSCLSSPPPVLPAQDLVVVGLVHRHNLRVGEACLRPASRAARAMRWCKRLVGQQADAGLAIAAQIVGSAQKSGDAVLDELGQRRRCATRSPAPRMPSPRAPPGRSSPAPTASGTGPRPTAAARPAPDRRGTARRSVRPCWRVRSHGLGHVRAVAHQQQPRRHPLDGSAGRLRSPTARA